MLGAAGIDGRAGSASTSGRARAAARAWSRRQRRRHRGLTTVPADRRLAADAEIDVLGSPERPRLRRHPRPHRDQRSRVRHGRHALQRGSPTRGRRLPAASTGPTCSGTRPASRSAAALTRHARRPAGNPLLGLAVRPRDRIGESRLLPRHLRPKGRPSRLRRRPCTSRSPPPTVSPLMTGAAFRDLVDAIRTHGVKQPILLLGGYIDVSRRPVARHAGVLDRASDLDEAFRDGVISADDAARVQFEPEDVRRQAVAEVRRKKERTATRPARFATGTTVIRRRIPMRRPPPPTSSRRSVLPNCLRARSPSQPPSAATCALSSVTSRSIRGRPSRCASVVRATEWHGADRDGLRQQWNGRVWVFTTREGTPRMRRMARPSRSVAGGE